MENYRCNCVIGFYHDYDDSRLYRLSMLERFISDCSYYKRKVTRKEKVLEQLNRLFTKQYATDSYIEMFDYCPMCREKIDMDLEKIVEAVLEE